MKSCTLALLVNPAVRTATLTALFLGLVATAPVYGQESQRDRMAALHDANSAQNPPSLEHSERPSLTTGTELLLDGGFEGGYYGGSQTLGTYGVTGPWTWYNNPSELNPIWQNYGGTNARTGNFMAYFNPFGPSRSQIWQSVSIPSGVTATLSFWVKIGSVGGNPADKMTVNFTDWTGQTALGTFVKAYSDSDAVGFSWVNYTYDVSAYAGQQVILLFTVDETGSTIFQLDDVSLLASTAASTTCVEDALTMCLVNGRYRITSHWQNQYAGGAAGALFKTTLTNLVGAFWYSGPTMYEYFVRINTATDNGRAWVQISMFNDVEFWVAVSDTKTGQYKQYHNNPGNETLIYDPYFFVYP